MAAQYDNKLSIIARADDVSRRMNCLMDMSTEDFLISLVKISRDMCCDLRLVEEEKDNWKKKCLLLEDDYSVLDRKLKNTQECYRREVHLKERILKEKESLREKLCQVKELLREDFASQPGDLKAHRVLSCLDINLERVDEMNESGGDYLDPGDLDKSDEIPLNRPSSCVQLKRATKSDMTEAKRFCLDDTHDIGIEANEDIDSRFLVKQANEKLPTLQSTPVLHTNHDILRFPTQVKLSDRAHKFVSKTNYGVSEKCTVCAKKIGFANSCQRCSECQALCHPQCDKKLPLPCISYVPRQNAKKKGRLTTVADYVSRTSHPLVPALIIHCCGEIEKRGLKETGLYRIAGSDADTKQLKEKILSSKNGMPVLSTFDVHVLACVVKSFLNTLDDPIISKVLYRQFSEAVKIEDHDEHTKKLYEAINELPPANRHTLAYLMLHFQRVAASPFCNMPIDNLSKVLAPTIVGCPTSTANPTQFQEVHQQIKILKSLLSVPQNYWEKILNDNVVNASSPIANAISKRQSIGARVIGGTLNAEVLLPKHRIKPLF